MSILNSVDEEKREALYLKATDSGMTDVEFATSVMSVAQLFMSDTDESAQQLMDLALVGELYLKGVLS